MVSFRLDSILPSFPRRCDAINMRQHKTLLARLQTETAVSPPLLAFRSVWRHPLKARGRTRNKSKHEEELKGSEERKDIKKLTFISICWANERDCWPSKDNET